jgi:hypothetical protein
MHRSRLHLTRRCAAVIAAVVTTTGGVLLASGGSALANGSGTFIGGLNQTKVIASTIPKNGDVNPYGVAVVPRTTGNLHKGDVLVSNFNDNTNAQGTGTTIVEVNPQDHQAKLFAGITDSNCPGGVGLTTALVALRSGWVIVGSLPTMNGNISGPGCLIVLDQWGNVKSTITGHGIDGPWDMTALDFGPITELFVTNVLGGILGSHPNPNGGTVQRLIITSFRHHTPQVIDSDTIGSGFSAKLDMNALVLGPTGVGLGRDGTLYVADTVNNRIAAIPHAIFREHSDGNGTTISTNSALMAPLGLAIAPNGHILTVNGGDGNIVETTPDGQTVAVKTIDTNMGGAGNLFGLAVVPHQDAVYFVDDFGMQNNLQLFF